MRFFNLIRSGCEYSKKCKNFQEGSFTCKKAVDKSYCGTYKQLTGGSGCGAR
jgi:hypothetical protein